MAMQTFIARAVDGLVLTESRDVTNGVSPEAKRQAIRLLTSLYSAPQRASVEAVGYVFHFAIFEGICYLGVFDRVYPKNFAFTFLEEVQVLFRQELQVEFGSGSVDYRSHVECVEKPYRFQRLDRQIGRKAEEFRDTTSSKAITRLHAGLTEVSSIMRCNIDELLQRGDSLQDVARKASNLSMASKDFSKMSGELWFQTLLRKYGILVLVVVVMLVVLAGLVLTEDAVAPAAVESEMVQERVEYVHGVASAAAEAENVAVVEPPVDEKRDANPPEPEAPAIVSASEASSQGLTHALAASSDAEGVSGDVGLLAGVGGFLAAIAACMGVLLRSRAASSAAPARSGSYSTVPIASSFSYELEQNLQTVGGYL